MIPSTRTRGGWGRCRTQGQGAMTCCLSSPARTLSSRPVSSGSAFYLRGKGVPGRKVAATRGAAVHLVLTGPAEVVEVPPSLTSRERSGRPGQGKTDPLDAVAIARITAREPALPPVRLAVGQAADLRRWATTVPSWSPSAPPWPTALTPNCTACFRAYGQEPGSPTRIRQACGGPRSSAVTRRRVALPLPHVELFNRSRRVAPRPRHPEIGAEHVDACLALIGPVVSKASHGVYAREADSRFVVAKHCRSILIAPG